MSTFINNGEIAKVGIGEQYQDFIARVLNAKEIFEEKDLFIKEKDPTVKTITFQVTEACNLRCTYCYQINKSPAVLSLETAKEFIDLLIESSYDENNKLWIGTTSGIVMEFIGGEPLLEIELVDQIVDYFRVRLIQENHPWVHYNAISFISNGVKYFDDKVQAFLNKNKDIVSFAISLDGNKELHDSCRVFPDGSGSYDLAVAGCKHYMENYNPNMYTKMTFAPENISSTYDAFVNLVSLGYKYIHANPVYEDVWCLDDAKLYYKELKRVADFLIEDDRYKDVQTAIFNNESFCPCDPKDNQNYCGSTGCMVSVDYNGFIYPCVRFMKSSLGKNVEPFIIGDVKHGIGVLPEHKEKIDILDSITRMSQSSEKCNNCQIGAGCGWCTAYNYQVTGTPNKRLETICEMHQARSLANVYFWNKIYRKEGANDRFIMHIPKDWALEIINEEEYNMLLELTKPKDA